MSMRPPPSFGDIKLQYHEFKTSAEACVESMSRKYGEDVNRLSQELRLKTIEIQKMRDKYEPKKDEKPKQ